MRNEGPHLARPTDGWWTVAITFRPPFGTHDVDRMFEEVRAVVERHVGRQDGSVAYVTAGVVLPWPEMPQLSEPAP